MSTEQKSGLAGAYDKRDFEAGPRIYSDRDFIQKIFDASELGNFEDIAKVGDFMSGPGKVGLGLREISPNHHYIFLDLAGNQLRKISLEPGVFRIRGDAKYTPFKESTFDVVVCRYAIKDLTQFDQPMAFREIRRILKPRGIFVFADMISPNDATKDWLNRQHSLKQEFGGRNPSVEGKCHIPTVKEWRETLIACGLQSEIFSYHISHVDTHDWVKGGQVTQDQLVTLNHMILTAPSGIINEFKIHSVSHPHWVGKDDLTTEELRKTKDSVSVEIEYPTVILKVVRKD